MSEKVDPAAASVSAIGAGIGDGIRDGDYKKAESDNSMKLTDADDAELQHGQIENSYVLLRSP